MSFLGNKILYHFVGFGSAEDDEANFRTLCAVLESRQIGASGMASIQVTIDPSRRPQKGELLQQSITCYCDIPFEELALHVQKYGRFGVGVDRKTVSAFGARTVSYVPVVNSWPAGSAGSFFLKDLSSLLHGICEHLAPECGNKTTSRQMGQRPSDKQETVDRLEAAFTKDFLAFLKFFDADLPIEHLDYYYAEREWRKFGPFPLGIGLKEIVVPSEYVARIEERFPHFSKFVRELK